MVSIRIQENVSHSNNQESPDAPPTITVQNFQAASEPKTDSGHVSSGKGKFADYAGGAGGPNRVVCNKSGNTEDEVIAQGSSR